MKRLNKIKPTIACWLMLFSFAMSWGYSIAKIIVNDVNNIEQNIKFLIPDISILTISIILFFVGFINTNKNEQKRKT